MMPSGASGPPFFVVGSARSGTTLLRLMLNAHPDVAVPPESRFITELYTEEEVDAEATLRALGDHHRFGAWELSLDDVRRELGRTGTVRFVDVISAAYRAYTKAHGKTRWGDKTPRYVEHIPLISGLFPDARFVHLVRDGRNVALSYADVPFGPKTVGQVAELWGGRVAAGIAAGRRLGGDRYLEVRYERLTEAGQTESQLQELCDFLLLPFDPKMLEYTEQARSAVLDRATQYNPHIKEGVRSHVRSWESSMPDEHIEIFEAVAGEVLSQLGYERRFPHPGRMARAKGALSKLGIRAGGLHRSREAESSPREPALAAEEDDGPRGRS
ncbi:sulfotransferase [soil metagenome]